MFSKKNLLFLIGRDALIAIFAAAMASTATFFLVHKITETAARVEQARELSRSLEQQTELVSLIRRDGEIVGTNKTLIEGAFLSSDDILNFTSALEKLAENHSFVPYFRFGTPTLAPIETPIPLAVIPYDLTIPHGLANLITYLKDFERLPYFTKINSITFSTENAGGWTTGGSASLGASLYVKN